jgi:hypothetical protein
MSLALQKNRARRLQRGRASAGPPASAVFGRAVSLLDAIDGAIVGERLDSARYGSTKPRLIA